MREEMFWREVRAPLVSGQLELEEEMLKKGYVITEFISSRVNNISTDGNPTYYQVWFLARKLDESEKALVAKVFEERRLRIQELRERIEEIESLISNLKVQRRKLELELARIEHKTAREVVFELHLIEPK